MRAIWSGEIAFGLVNVPVKLYSATRSHDVSFHQVHDEDNGRIRYQRHCEVCGREVEYEDIAKAYDDGDKTVILTDEELDALPAEDNDQIDVVQFVPNDQVDPILLGTSYFLEPVGRSPKSYVLLRRTLEATERTAIVHFTLRSKTRLGVLRRHEDLLVLQTLRWPSDLKQVDFAPSGRTKVTDKELTMSAALVEQFSGDLEPDQYSDEYQEQLRTLIDEKLEQGDSVDTEETFGKERAEQDKKKSEGSEGEGSGKVLSLMDALERSLSKRRGAGGSNADEGTGAAGDDGSDAAGDEDESAGSTKSTSGSGGKKSSGSSGSGKGGAKKGGSKGGKKSSSSKSSSSTSGSGGTKKSSSSKSSSSKPGSSKSSSSESSASSSSKSGGAKKSGGKSGGGKKSASSSSRTKKAS